MTDAIRDENHVPSWLGTSYVDGVTLVPIKIDSSSGGMVIDEVNTIGFTPDSPEVAGRDQNRRTVLMGVSSVDGTPFPVLVDPTTGGVLIDIL